MNLTTLPDDVLLHILRFLQTRELLQCRGACRRLRDWALHPDVWRHRRLSLSSNCVQLVAATLRLAPCLGTLELRLKQDETNLQLASLLVSTNCAVSKVSFEIQETGAVLAVMALARQTTLGRLSTVSLRLLPSCDDESNLRLLLDQILYTRGLTSIQLEEKIYRSDIDVPPGPCLAKAAKDDANAMPASLQRLEHGFGGDRLLSYLQWHAATLRVVLLGSVVQPPAGTAALLSALPHLRKLECRLLDGMPALLACPALKSLHLHVNVNAATRPFYPGVVTYLRQAVVSQLKTLKVQFAAVKNAMGRTVGADEVNLVLSLAGPDSGAASALRSLQLNYDGEAWEPQPQLPPLAAVLHRLTNLASLDLDGPHTPDFLQALDGKVLPSLGRLRIVLASHRQDEWGGGCPHQWAHGDELRALLRRYPRLHVVLQPIHDPGCPACHFDGCDVCRCGFCDAHSCHNFQAFDLHVLFSHADHELCSSYVSDSNAVQFLVEL